MRPFSNCPGLANHGSNDQIIAQTEAAIMQEAMASMHHPELSYLVPCAMNLQR